MCYALCALFVPRPDEHYLTAQPDRAVVFMIFVASKGIANVRAPRWCGGFAAAYSNLPEAGALI